MGNKQSNVQNPVRQTKAVRQQKEEKRQIIQEHVKQENKESLNIVQDAADQQFRENKITREEYINSTSTIARVEELIDRGSDPFVKDDYIAIIIRLDGKYLAEKDTLQKKRVKDLIFIIRSIIYETNSILDKINPTIKQETNQQPNPHPNPTPIPLDNVPNMIVTHNQQQEQSSVIVARNQQTNAVVGRQQEQSSVVVARNQQKNIISGKNRSALLMEI